MEKNNEAIQGAVEAGAEMSITLDVADLVGTVVWPLFILVLILISKKQLPVFFKSLAAVFHRAEKITIGNFSMDLAKAKAIAPQWTPADSTTDIRKSMSSAEVTDSTAWHFTNQLTDTTAAEYALVDLGEGKEWLSSRLYIISILLERAKETRALVFVRTAGKKKRRLIGWAEPEVIRWSLAQTYPWLESAYARSYASIFPITPVPGEVNVKVVSRNGMLGTEQEGASPSLLIRLMQTFLQEVQSPVAPIPEEEQWVPLQANVPTWEHACWLTADDIEDMVDDDFNKQFIYARELDALTEENRVKRLLEVKQAYVPIVDDGELFRELIDREVVASQVLQAVT